MRQFKLDIGILQNKKKNSVLNTYGHIKTRLEDYIEKYTLFKSYLIKLRDTDYINMFRSNDIWSTAQPVRAQNLESEIIVGDKKYLTKHKFISDMENLLKTISEPKTSIIDIIKEFIQNKKEYDTVLGLISSQTGSGGINFDISKDISKLNRLLEDMQQIFQNYSKENRNKLIKDIETLKSEYLSKIEKLTKINSDCELLFNSTSDFMLFYEKFIEIFKRIIESLKDIEKQVFDIKSQCEAIKLNIKSLWESILFNSDHIKLEFKVVYEYTIGEIDSFLEKLNSKYYSNIESTTKRLSSEFGPVYGNHKKLYDMIKKKSYINLPHTFKSSLQCYEYFLLQEQEQEQEVNLGILHSITSKTEGYNTTDQQNTYKSLFIKNGEIKTLTESSSLSQVFIKFNKDYLQKYIERINSGYFPIDSELLQYINTATVDILRGIQFHDIDGNTLQFIDVTNDNSDTIKPFKKVTFTSKDSSLPKIFHTNEIFISMTDFYSKKNVLDNAKNVLDDADLYA